MGDDRIVTLAAVVGAHGITGEVRLKVFAEDLAAYPVLHAGERTLTVKSLRPGPNGSVARFAEVSDRTTAEALRGTALGVPRSALPPLGEGEYYHADLVDADAVTPDGVSLGRIAEVVDYGAGDLIEIARADGRRFLVPVAAGVADLGPPVVVRSEFVE